MKRRATRILVGTVIALLFMAFIIFRRVPIRGNFPSKFSGADKRQISSLVLKDAYRRSFISLIHADFKSSWEWMVSAQRQRAWLIGNQPDGEIWVHLGVEDKSQPDGYSTSARYFMKKENGYCKLGALF